jgi:hypothetical protein
MANGTNGDPPLPALASNGIKLLSEAVIPGGSLLLEKHIGSGVGAAAVGILGGAVMSAVFGPLGYLLTRVGASAVSYSAAVAPPPPPPTSPATNHLIAENTSAIKEFTKQNEVLQHVLEHVLAEMKSPPHKRGAA